MKIKIIFESEKYGTITNNRPFIDNDDMEEEEFGGCIVTFDTIPMYQDYLKIINKLWVEQLQWDYPNNKMKNITTEIIQN